MRNIGMTRLQKSILDKAAEMIQGMIDEDAALPRFIDAPSTLNAASVLRARLEVAGYKFKKKKPRTFVKTKRVSKQC